ncbi:MAG: DUF1553 domain-containing protein [Planctomycetaceae bacterium]|nr:DUF1553 domain-containing protein [Planctomycetaceae bacterium]
MTIRYENHQNKWVSILRHTQEILTFVFLMMVTHACMAKPGFAQGTATTVNFNRDIRPLLSDRCFHCHGPDEQDRKAGLRLDRRDGDEGALNALTPNDVAGSELYKRITSTDPDVVMPPPDAHKKPISPEEQKLFKAWIEEGGNYETFWAFTSLEPPSFPPANDSTWGTGPIDRFVKRKLDEHGISPQPAGDRRTLLRRLSLDLTGLPPSRSDISEFLADQSANSYEKAVDRLLKSPKFGEHMGRHWLDLVRFADTNGIHHDHYRDLSPYRDWVIRSFNENLPYDDFVRYQLAGDLYDAPSNDQLTASGFNRLHMIIDRGTMLPEESHARNVIDRVTSVGTAFMGLTVGCAVCHDHKYDPISSREFYQLYAFFNNIDANPETGGRSGNDFKRGLQKPYIELPSPEQQKARENLLAKTAALDKQITELKAAMANLAKEKGAETSTSEKTSEEEEASEKKAAEKKAAEKKAVEKKTAEHQQEIKQLETKRNELRAELSKLEMLIPAAMIMKERSDIRPAHMMIRGAYDDLGEQVERGTPAFLPPMPEISGRPKSRMDLANWFVSDEHPLTARVAVNRFWQQLFGVGIVKTAEDIGAQGEWPSHPDLLNYLASQFVNSDWNLKSLIKEMVMSETYRQSSQATPTQYKTDPENRLLARGSRYRLDAEVIRDQILATSGVLSSKMGGKSVKPPQPEGLWKSVSLPSSYPSRYVPDSGEQVVRRSVYTFWKRGLPPPQMTILNAPTREDCTARRERTNTPLQALLLMNEQQYMKAAQQLAVQALNWEEEGRLAAVYETITGKVPDTREQEILQKALDDFETFYQERPALTEAFADKNTDGKHSPHAIAAWAMIINTIYNLDITKTRS